MVLSPTRGENILDLVFTNDPSLISSVNTDDEFLNSDHKIVIVTMSISSRPLCHSNKPNIGARFCFSRAEWSKYRYLLAQNSRDVLLHSDCVDGAWSILKGYILSAADAAVPRSYQTS